MLIILMILVLFNIASLANRNWFICHFIVIVCGASLGISLLVNYTRSLSKEIEIYFINLLTNNIINMLNCKFRYA